MNSKRGECVAGHALVSSKQARPLAVFTLPARFLILSRLA